MIFLIQHQIAQRVASLRIEKGVSAREMSLSLGMAENYINNVENERAVPSMEMFACICDYLLVSYSDFFNEKKTSPVLQNKLLDATTGLQNTQIETLVEIAYGYHLMNNKGSQH